MSKFTVLLASALLTLSACDSSCAPNCKQSTTLLPPASDINATGSAIAVPPAPKTSSPSQ